MKFNNLFNLVVLGSALTITGFGCKTHPQKPINIPGQPNHIGEGNIGGGNTLINPNPGDFNNTLSTSNGISQVSGGDFAGWKEDSSALSAQTVYFDFDKSAIKSSEQSKLNDVASYMKSHSGAAIRIEGNCDARGTEEYNRALGDRRAQSAREYLVNLGVPANMIPTRSNGMDKPAEQGKGEAAYAKNRRDEFIVLTPP